MKKEGDNMLHERHMKAIEMLVEGSSMITAIAKEVDVTRTTLYSWMKRDDFKSAGFEHVMRHADEFAA